MTDASVAVLNNLRSTANMQWYVVPLLIFVIYVYVTEAEKKNWSAVLLGIATWAGELVWEMFNALVLHFTQYASMWSTPGKSAFIIYSGLNIEIASFFAVAGVIVVKSLPEDRHLKILGISNRIFLPVFWGLVAVFVEVLLNQCDMLIWDYAWWSWPNIWLIVIVYILPWALITWAHDNLTLKAKKIGAIAAVCSAIVCHVTFAVILGWI